MNAMNTLTSRRIVAAVTILASMTVAACADDSGRLNPTAPRVPLGSTGVSSFVSGIVPESGVRGVVPDAPDLGTGASVPDAPDRTPRVFVSQR